MAGEILNPFADQDAFGMVSLTEGINVVPNKYGRLLTSGIFVPEPVRLDKVALEEHNSVLRLLTTQPKGGPAPEAVHGKRRLLTLTVPPIPLSDVILPSAYSGIRAFGTENVMRQYQDVMAQYLEENHGHYEITWEHLMWGALKGEIKDGDGLKVLYNLFDFFGIAKKTINFALANDDTEVDAKCREVIRHIEDNLQGETSNGVHAFVSSEFFDALITHPSVKEKFLNHSGVAALTQKDPRKGFVFAGINFEEFRGQASPQGGGPAVKFIAADYGHAIPTGTHNTFRWIQAPGEFMETVNTLGKALYAKSKAKDFDKGVDLYFESVTMPICKRPGVLVELVK